MRILIISSYYPPFELGGWPQLTNDIVTLFQKNGHQVLVLTSRHRAEEINGREPDVLRVLHLESPDHEHYHPHYTLLSRWCDRQNTRYLRQVIASFEPDVVFIHGLWNMSQRVAVDAECFFQGRVIYYMASHWPTDTNAHVAYWRSPPVTPWLYRPKKWFGRLSQRLFLAPAEQPKFARVLCVSAFIQNYLVNQVDVPRENTQVVYNGIDVHAFRPAFPVREDRSILQLLYAGGLWEHKGVPTAIEAVDQLVNVMDVQNIHLTLVGAGHPTYVKQLADQIKASRLEAFISFQDRVPRSQMPILLQQYDALVFPSTGPEALARIVQEAMACGLVVIGSRMGGTPEIILDGENGLTFEAGDARMLSEKIALIAKDQLLRERLSRAGRKTVEERFTIERMVDEIEACLLEYIRG